MDSGRRSEKVISVMKLGFGATRGGEPIRRPRPGVFSTCWSRVLAYRLNSGVFDGFKINLSHRLRGQHNMHAFREEKKKKDWNAEFIAAFISAASQQLSAHERFFPFSETETKERRDRRWFLEDVEVSRILLSRRVKSRRSR